MTTLDVPYLIVGAGPVGLTAAQLLANGGQRCLVVERRDGPQRSPAAHVVNARTLEIFHQARFDMQSIDALACDPHDAGHVNFVTRLNGSLIGRLPFERQGDECLAHTPFPLRNISQHHLEPLLSKAVAERPEVDLRYDHEWVSAHEDADGVTSVIRDLRSGDTVTVHSSYLLGADGAGSPVRKSVGIEMVGPAGIQSFVAIHFLADLRRHVDGRPGVLHFVMDPEAAGCLIAHDIDREWVFMHSFDPRAETIDDYSAERCVGLVRAAIGDPEVSVDFVGAGTWHMTAQVATHMRRGRVFLVGDAAHRFPPTGGMGLNTGVADAHNLVWKLLAVDTGQAQPSLLDSYERERRPIADINCHQSLTNAFKMVLLAQALGLHPGATSAELEAAVADPTRATSIADAVTEQATHFDMLGLQLGYVYPLDGSEVSPTDIDPRVFEPTGAVGARLPHGWLDDTTSTLDVVAPNGFTLISVGVHDEWAAAVQHIGATHVAIDDEQWRLQCGLGEGGALLVRPDQHIAWRTDHLPADPASAVAGAVAAALR